jgi:glycerophosphoryl diester phosphodiesterase
MNVLHNLEAGLLKLVNGFYAVRPQPFPGNQRLNACKIISHRGEHNNTDIFENTLAAFDLTAENNVWGIECDLRWTRDLQPVIIHDPDLIRVFGIDATVCEVTLAELTSACPRVPSLQDVVQRYGKRLHIMLEIKEEVYPDPVHQNRVHIITLRPQMFRVITFVPESTFLPIARFNVSELSQLARRENYGGLAGHYVLLTQATLDKHHAMRQKVGTGYIGSKACLFRELNRGVEWIFSNNAAAMQKLVDGLLKSDRSDNSS